MKLLKNHPLLMSLPVLLCAAVLLAGAAEKKKIPRTAATAALSATASAGLPPTIKIDLKHIPNTKLSAEIKSLSPAFYAAWARVEQCTGYLRERIPQYEEQKRIYIAKCRECRDKTYTAAEMSAAGCLPTDTIADCSQKLYRKCVGPYEVDILDMLVDVQCLADYGKQVRDEFFNSILNPK